MKYLIVGRSGTGKDTLRSVMEGPMFNCKFVKSYTTRKQRYPEEDTHIFINSIQTLAFQDCDKVAKTVISNGDCECQYFATKSQLNEADAYIVDPYGVYQVLANCPNEKFVIVYLYSSRWLKRITAVLKRGDGVLTAFGRLRSEQRRFDDFEHVVHGIATGSYAFSNVKHVCLLENMYNEKSLSNMTAEIGTVSRLGMSLCFKNSLHAFEKYLYKCIK